MIKLRTHPRTIDIVGICTKDATFLGIVTQYLPTGSLRGVLDAGGDAITPKVQFDWAKDIAIGMAYLHEVGVLHRDLKSQNVLLTNDWRCKITDFGISKSEALNTMATMSTMRGGGISGTFPFTAPEAFSSKTRFTAKCDVYSYSIVLWEIWDRGKPWDGLDLPEIMEAVRFNRERLKVPGLMPVELSDLMCCAWSHDAAARPDFKDIVTQLRDFGSKLNDPTSSGLPVLCRCLDDLSKSRRTEWIDASAVSMAYYKKLGRDTETLKKVRDSANKRALIQIGRKNKYNEAFEVVPSTMRQGPMKARLSAELYFRLTPEGRGLLES